MPGDPLLDLVRPRLAAARWFGGKGRPAELTEVIPLPWLVAPGTAGLAIRPALARVRYTDVPANDGHADELYQVVLAYGPERPVAWGPVPGDGGGRVWVGDVADDPEACAVLWEALRTASSDDGLHVERLEEWPVGLTARRFTGEQSNTSLLYGDTALLKIFRKIDAGPNLDIDVHRALTRRGSRAAARMLGAVTVDPVPDVLPAATDLVMVVEQLGGAVDGWQAALDALAAGRSFSAEAHSLGAALAQVHAVLAEAFGTSRTSGERLAATWSSQARSYAEVAPALSPALPGLQSLFSRVSGREVDTQRVHGDCHLGQALLTPEGWKIIDFEGEPVKPLAERARPDSVWRDVAGLLRSFDYAIASVPHADPAAAAAWHDACRSALLAGYVDGTGAPIDAVLLAGYEADRAAYEVVYETRNRPEWVSIPLRAVGRLAGADVTDRRRP